MPLSDHVSLTISQDTVGVARAGFGVPLILSVNAAWPERTRTYDSLLDVVADFTATSPEYLAAAAMFAQTPKPSRIKIGRAAGKPTLAYTITPTAANLTVYSIVVKGQGVTTTTVSYTSDSSATVAEITAALTTALNAVVGNNYIAVDNTTNVTVTADAPGGWFALDVNDISLLAILQTHAEPATTLATDLAAISVVDDDWYALYTLYNSTAYVAAAAAYIETVKKIYTPDVCDSSACTVAESAGTDVLDDIDEFNYTRSAGFWHQYPSQFAGAAWLGRCLPLEPGSLTFAYKTLAGVTVPPITASHRTNLRARGASYYTTAAGVDFTWEGMRGDGGYIDVARDLDYLEDRIGTAVLDALVSNDKVAYTDAGVSLIKGEIKAELAKAIDKGILADDPAPTVTAPRVADIDSTSKATRRLPDVKFSATLAGAIHSVTITGVVSA